VFSAGVHEHVEHPQRVPEQRGSNWRTISRSVGHQCVLVFCALQRTVIVITTLMRSTFKYRDMLRPVQVVLLSLASAPLAMANDPSDVLATVRGEIDRRGEARHICTLEQVVPSCHKSRTDAAEQPADAARIEMKWASANAVVRAPCSTRSVCIELCRRKLLGRFSMDCRQQCPLHAGASLGNRSA